MSTLQINLPLGKYAIGGIVFLLIAGAVGLWWWSSRPTLPRGPAPAISEAQSVTFTSGSDLTFTDSSGNKQKEEKPGNVGEVDQTLVIDTLSVPRKLLVEKQRAWFPEIRNKPSVRLRGLTQSDTKGVTSTVRGTPLLGFHWKSIMVGGSYVFGEGPAVSTQYLPLRIWAFRFGPSAHLTREGIHSHLSSAVEIREHLHLSVGLNSSVVVGNGVDEISVGLVYGF